MRAITLFFIFSIITLLALSLSYAQFSETLRIGGPGTPGNTVSTGELDAGFSACSCSDSDGDGIHDGEVACELIDNDGDGDSELAVITIANAYPCYEATCNLTIEDTGSIPLHIKSVNIDNPDPDELDVSIENDPNCTILDVGRTVTLNVTAHVTENAGEEEYYNFTVTVDIQQFNYAPSPTPTPPIKPLTNGGFEMGDFTGWSLTIPEGATAQVVTSHIYYERRFYPVEGNYFALLKTDGPDSLTKLSQEFEIDAGMKLQGWAAFDGRSSESYNDYAQVRILDSEGNVVATPWYCDISTVGGYKYKNWTKWEWTANTSGTYILELSVANARDSHGDSYALFDANVITT